MPPFVSTVRRRWAFAAALLLLGVVVAAALVSASSDPTASRSGPAAPPASARPAAAPSSGPTGTPEPGSLDVVSVQERPTARPVPFRDPARFRGGMTLRVTRAEAVTGVARGPGEIAGPAVRLTFALHNGTGRKVSLESVVMSASYGAGDTPAATLTGPGARDIGGTLAAGGTATGRYVFAIPQQERDDVTVVASYTGPVPAVSFTGAVR